MKRDTDLGAKATSHNLLSMTRGHRLRYLLAIAVSAGSNVCLMGGPMIGMYAIDVTVARDLSIAPQVLQEISKGLAGPDSFLGFLVVASLLAVAVTSVAGVLQFVRNRISAVVSEAIALRLRESLFSTLQHARPRFFDHEETGDLVQRCTSDVNTVKLFMHEDVDQLGRVLLFLAAMLPILFWRNETLTWLSLVLMPALVVFTYYFFARITSVFRVADESEGALTAEIQESITGVRVVQAFDRQEHELERFSVRNKDFRDKYVHLNNIESWYWMISDLLCYIQTGVVLIVGGALVIAGSLTVGELFMFYTLIIIVLWRIRQVGMVIEKAGKAVVAVNRINHILTTPTEPIPSRKRDNKFSGRIEFKNVSLSYDEESNVLNDISLVLEPGESIGIVGAPGSGKSTLLRVLMGFYPIQDGQVLVDGEDIASIDLLTLRSQIAVVMQEPFLFSRNIRNNLLIGRDSANQYELAAVSEQAAVHSAIEGFSDGYDAMIGERGVTLSGGQRQRLAIARALLKDAPILLLDDALSAVDTQTEESILESLQLRERKRTTLIVAHRLTTVRHVDRILVLDQGRIAQLGTHDELSAVDGIYRELCELQDLLNESIRIETARASNG